MIIMCNDFGKDFRIIYKILMIYKTVSASDLMHQILFCKS